MKTIYISGPMRGYPHLNFPAFQEADDFLRGLGFNVINPATRDIELGIDPDAPLGPDGFPVGIAPETIIRRDVDDVFASDAMFMLLGWEVSTGANCEHYLMKFLQRPIFFRSDFSLQNHQNNPNILNTNEAPRIETSPSCRGR